MLTKLLQKRFACHCFCVNYEFSGEETFSKSKSRENEYLPPHQICAVRTRLRVELQKGRQGQIPPLHRQEKLAQTKRENQNHHAQNQSHSLCRAHWATEPPNGGLGQLLPTRHRLSETQRPGFVDTLPPAVLYLETMETTETSASSVSSIGGGGKLGAPICLLPYGRLGNRV